MRLAEYIDTTYLKKPNQANISEEATKQNIIKLVEDAIAFDFKLVMIRANYISLAKEMIHKANSSVQIGTVIGFHEGNYSLEKKLKEAQIAIDLGVDDLDYVLNYKAFKNGNIALIEEEVLRGTALGLKNQKVVKWIIEVAALSNDQIAVISSLIKNLIVANFGNEKAQHVYVKSSTGFYKTEGGKPNGATLEAIKIMHDNAKPLKIKAAGGVKTKEDALKMITLGVQRIGTSAAVQIVNGIKVNSEY